MGTEMEWFPTEEILVQGQLDIFWVLPLPKVDPGQGVILFIKCQRVEFLCKLKTELAGQKKANKNCMKFGVGWGWVASLPADLAFTAWKRKLNLSKSWVHPREMHLTKNKPSVWREIHEAVKARGADHLFFFFLEGNVENSNSLFSLCSFKIYLMPTLYSDMIGTGKHI